MRRIKRRKGNSGSGTLVMLASLFTFVLMFTPLTERFMLGKKAAASVDRRGQFHDLQAYLKNRLSCSESFPIRPSACGGQGGYLTLRAHRPTGEGSLIGPVLVEAPRNGGYMKIGRFLVRARCEPCQNCLNNVVLKMEASLGVTASGAPMVDPLTKRMLDGELPGPSPGIEQGWAPLFAGGPPLCVIP